jgi:hypothetical protein
MQTFLPDPLFGPSAEVIDNLRLRKQLVEVQQIIMALDDPTYGWQHHPAINMWRGHRGALCEYGLACYNEWIVRLERGERGGVARHASGDFIFREWLKCRDFSPPPWLGDERIHGNHRARLLHKDQAHYGQFGWSERPTRASCWPDSSGGVYYILDKTVRTDARRDVMLDRDS